MQQRSYSREHRLTASWRSLFIISFKRALRPLYLTCTVTYSGQMGPQQA